LNNFIFQLVPTAYNPLCWLSDLAEQGIAYPAYPSFTVIIGLIGSKLLESISIKQENCRYVSINSLIGPNVLGGGA